MLRSAMQTTRSSLNTGYTHHTKHDNPSNSPMALFDNTCGFKACLNQAWTSYRKTFCAYTNIAPVQQGCPDSGIGGTASSMFLVREKAKPVAPEATQPSLAKTTS